jgi:hypothetical protein
VPAPTAAAEALAAEVERKLVLPKADEMPPSSSATALVEEQRTGRESQAALAAPGSLPPVSSKAEKFPARPGFGTVGKRCRVRANHFLVQVADQDIHHYDVRVFDYSVCMFFFYAVFCMVDPVHLVGFFILVYHSFDVGPVTRKCKFLLELI